MSETTNIKKYIVNTFWLFFDQIINIGLLAGTNIFVTRYLGASNYGVIGYVNSFISIFSVIACLGLDSIIVKKLVTDKENTNKILNTAFVLNASGALLSFSALLIYNYLFIKGARIQEIMLILSPMVLFQSFKFVEYYFYSQVQSRRLAATRITVNIVISAAKILFMLWALTLKYFAALFSLNVVLQMLGYFFVLRRNKSINLRFEFDKALAKEILKKSFPLLISGIVIMTYLNLDVIMLKNILYDDKLVGLYAAAVKTTGMFFFIPAIIVDTLFPGIVKLKERDESEFLNKIRVLMSLLLIIGIVICTPMIAFPDFIMTKLYGNQFTGSGDVLKIYGFITILVFLGAVRGKWLVINKQEKLLAIFAAIALGINVILNLILIPEYGIEGAAFATLIAIFFNNYLLYFIYPKTRQMFYAQNRAIYKIFNIKDYFRLFNLRKKRVN